MSKYLDDFKIKEELNHIFVEYWTPLLIEKACKGDSPPEKLLAMCLNTLLFDKVIDNQVSIIQQEEIITNNKKKIRPDFSIEVKDRKEKVFIECDGYSYHRRTPEEFTNEIKRERELIKIGHTVYRFSAKELFDDPWECALEAIEFLALKFQDNFIFSIDEKMKNILKIKDEPSITEQIKDQALISVESNATTLQSAFIELRRFVGFPSYTLFRRFVVGSHSKKVTNEMRKSNYCGILSAKNLDQIALRSIYNEFTNEEKSPDPYITMANEEPIDIYKHAADYALNNLPTDNQHPEFRKNHPRAYMKWHNAEIEIVKNLYNSGCTIKKISELLKRQYGAISSRLSNEGLITDSKDLQNAPDSDFRIDIKNKATKYAADNQPQDDNHADVRKTHKRAFMKWGSTEENIVKELHQNDYSVDEIAELLQRQISSISFKVEKYKESDVAALPT